MTLQIIILSLFIFINTVDWYESEKLIPGDSFHNQKFGSLYIIPM